MDNRSRIVAGKARWRWLSVAGIGPSGRPLRARELRLLGCFYFASMSCCFGKDSACRDPALAVHASSSYKPALKEVMGDPTVQQRIADTKAAREARALQGFFDMMSRDPSRAFYGPGHVFAAAEMGAVQTLLISDAVLRARTVPARRRYLALLDEVQGSGGEVHVLSAAHPSGEQLGRITGLAAVLRFPLPELEDAEVPPPEELA